MNTNRIGGCVVVAVAASALTACAGDRGRLPYSGAVFQDAETLTRAAVAATRMGASPHLRQLPGGQVALVPAHAPVVTAGIPNATTLAAGPSGVLVMPTPDAPATPLVLPSATPTEPPAPSRPQQAADRIREVEQALQAWRLAWELGDARTYMRFYDPEFKGDLPSRKAWEAQRRNRLANAKINVKVEKLQAQITGENVADLRFVQHYSSGRHHDVGEKHMRMQRVGGAWRIVQETWTAKN